MEDTRNGLFFGTHAKEGINYEIGKNLTLQTAHITFIVHH
jgi:hypothetical protein